MNISHTIILITSFLLQFSMHVMSQSVFVEGILEYMVTDSAGTTPIVAVTRMVGNPQRANQYEPVKLYIPSRIIHQGTEYVVSEIASGAFSNCNDIEMIELANGIEFVEPYAFVDCHKLETVYLPASLKSFCVPNFQGCRRLQSLSVANGNTTYDSRDGCNAIIDSKAKVLVCGICTSHIPDDICEIGNYAFYGCVSLRNVPLHDKIERIGDLAFAHCINIESVFIPENLKKLGSAALAHTSIKEINIPAHVEYIGSAPFMGCSTLSSISVNRKNKKYDSRKRCNAIIESSNNILIGGCRTTVIPNSIRTIRRDAFRNLLSLQTISIPKKITQIEGNPFMGCKSLVSINVANGNTTYDSRDGCNAIIDSKKGKLIAGCTLTHIPHDIETIGDFAFYGTYNASVLEIPVNIQHIGRYAFANLSSLKTLYLPTNMKTVEDHAFAGCSQLEYVDMPRSILSVSSTAFNGCNKLHTR